jgi:hypothetical protein
VLFVTLWYSLDDGDEDVVHIVCAREVDPQDRRLGMDGIYLEADDQSRGGYHGADRIVVSDDAVAIELNANGRKALALRDSVRLAWSGVEGRIAAAGVLGRMRDFECGKVVQLASP